MAAWETAQRGRRVALIKYFTMQSYSLSRGHSESLAGERLWSFIGPLPANTPCTAAWQRCHAHKKVRVQTVAAASRGLSGSHFGSGQSWHLCRSSRGQRLLVGGKPPVKSRRLRLPCPKAHVHIEWIGSTSIALLMAGHPRDSGDKFCRFPIPTAEHEGVRSIRLRGACDDCNRPPGTRGKSA